MSKYATKAAAIAAVTKIAQAEDGYLEKASAADLDDKTANAGYNNYTKYWRDLAELGLMGQEETFAGGPAWYWCAGFISWCFIQAFGQDIAKELLLHLPYISCANLGALAKAAGKLYDTPEEGDVVLFYNGSRFNHTGFVYSVSSTKFFTVEGNTNNTKAVVANGGGVCLKSYVISTYQKKGTMFFRPDYSLAVTATKTTSKTTDTKTTTSKTSTTKATTTTASTTTTKKTTTVYAKINTESSPLRCRKEANGSATVLGTFAKGTKVEVLAKTNANWWKVKGTATSGKTITGYSSAKYLKIV
jgi:hypothetical protein